MKNILILTGALLFSLAGCQSKKEHEAQEDHSAHEHTAPAAAADTLKKSIPMEEHAMIGSAHITIKYTAPAVRGRTIWGGLVPHNEVWVTGAHKATTFEINQAFKVGDQTIPAGKYALFTIPGEDKWTFIINKDWDQHLTDNYSAEKDAVRVEVVPEKLDTLQERLNYSVKKGDGKQATLEISWEKIKIKVPFSIV